MPTETVTSIMAPRPLVVAEVEEQCFATAEGDDSQLSSASECEWEDAVPEPEEVPPTEEGGSVVYEPEPNQEDVTPMRSIKHALKEMMELFDEMKDVGETTNPFNEHTYMKCCGWIRELYQFARDDAGSQLADNNDALVDYVVQLKRDEGRTKKALRLLLKDNTILMEHTRQLRGALDTLSKFAPPHRVRDMVSATADASEQLSRALDENHGHTLSAADSRSTEDRESLRAYTATLLESSDEGVEPLLELNPAPVEGAAGMDSDLDDWRRDARERQAIFLDAELADERQAAQERVPMQD